MLVIFSSKICNYSKASLRFVNCIGRKSISAHPHTIHNTKQCHFNKMTCFKHRITNFHKLDSTWWKITCVEINVVHFTKQRKHEIANTTSDLQNCQPLSTFLYSSTIKTKFHSRHFQCSKKYIKVYCHPVQKLLPYHIHKLSEKRADKCTKLENSQKCNLIANKCVVCLQVVIHHHVIFHRK